MRGRYKERLRGKEMEHGGREEGLGRASNELERAEELLLHFFPFCPAAFARAQKRAAVS